MILGCVKKVQMTVKIGPLNWIKIHYEGNFNLGLKKRFNYGCLFNSSRWFLTRVATSIGYFIWNNPKEESKVGSKFNFGPTFSLHFFVFRKTKKNQKNSKNIFLFLRSLKYVIYNKYSVEFFIVKKINWWKWPLCFF